MVIICIYVARTFFLLFYDDFMMTKTLNMSEHISTNIHPYKNIKGSIGKLYTYSIKREKKLWW